MKELRASALNCWKDANYVPVEHSEHCVLVAEEAFESRREDCETSRSYECMNYKLVRLDILYLYRQAVVRSLLTHGRTQPIQDAIESDGYMPETVHYDEALMRQLFDDCLEAEKQALAKDGLQRVHSSADQRLKENQLCFEAGYPEFRTEEI